MPLLTYISGFGSCLFRGEDNEVSLVWMVPGLVGGPGRGGTITQSCVIVIKMLFGNNIIITDRSFSMLAPGGYCSYSQHASMPARRLRQEGSHVLKSEVEPGQLQRPSIVPLLPLT